MANKLQQRALHYGNTINHVIEQTEEMQEKLDPMFQELKEKITSQDLASLSTDRYQEIRQGFAEGVQVYDELLTNLDQAQAPARLMGNHRQLVKAFRDFVEGCREMTESLREDQTIDQPQFYAAEAKQDESTERLSKHLARIGQLA